jgi:hypothetical protein
VAPSGGEDVGGERRAARGSPDDANHESPRTTKLYNRTRDLITLDEVEWIAI